jgi:hypothetical protein
VRVLRVVVGRVVAFSLVAHFAAFVDF